MQEKGDDVREDIFLRRIIRNQIKIKKGQS